MVYFDEIFDLLIDDILIDEVNIIKLGNFFKWKWRNIKRIIIRKIKLWIKWLNKFWTIRLRFRP